MGKPLYKLKRLCIILTLILMCASALPFAYPQTNAQASVNIEQPNNTELKISGTAAPNGRISIDIYRPGYDADDLISGNPLENLSALAYHDQFGADSGRHIRKIGENERRERHIHTVPGRRGCV